MGIAVEARCVTGNKAPLLTVMEGELERGWEDGKLPAFDAMCEVAPVSRNHSLA